MLFGLFDLISRLLRIGFVAGQTDSGDVSACWAETPPNFDGRVHRSILQLIKSCSDSVRAIIANTRILIWADVVFKPLLAEKIPN